MIFSSRIRGTAALDIVGHFPRRLTERHFWYVQVGFMVVTALHVATELPATAQYLKPLRDSTVMLYLIPMAYASLRYGWEGGLASGIWAGLLALPNAVLWHGADYTWLGELLKLVVVVFVGTFLAWRVEVEAGLRRRAEAAESDLRLLLHRATRAQEEERKRIARELHDDTAQDLATLRRELDEVLRQNDAPSPELAGRLVHACDLAADALSSIRRFSHDLRPPMLDDLGLAPALDSLLAAATSVKGTTGRFQVKGKARRLHAEAELTLYRIAQEAIRNAEKHAAPTSIEVTLAFLPKEVRLSVVDDGVGFNPQQLRRRDRGKSEGLGIIGMQERAALLGAQLDIDSAPGGGTRVVATCPIGD